MPPRTDSAIQKFTAANLLRFGQSLLTASGLAEDRARDVAEVLLEADLLGHTTHGFALLPAYLGELKKGTMETSGEPKIIADHGSALTWDGRYLPGPWLVRRAIAAARERMVQNPVVSVAIRRSHHIACLQAYLQPVTGAGLFILLTCSDPASRTVVPHGGTAPRFCPNPIAAGIPTDADPILIDISTSSTSNGVCNRAAAEGKRLPGLWLIDRDGNPTDDPRVLASDRGGWILPLGGLDLGYKGFAFALIVEALTNALAGHGYADDERRWGASVFLLIIDPERFGGRAAFLRETSFFAEYCRETPAPPQRPSVRLPGQAALAHRKEQLANGVMLHPTILPAVIPWAKELGVALPTAVDDQDPIGSAR
ncbi:MAG TPA: Ldh family oxidoreductase [Verrucomicrobiae bacterium]|nr:Ldh family oxidoreductase [Verrucomicrobiae bacterium]